MLVFYYNFVGVKSFQLLPFLLLDDMYAQSDTKISDSKNNKSYPKGDVNHCNDNNDARSSRRHNHE